MDNSDEVVKDISAMHFLHFPQVARLLVRIDLADGKLCDTCKAAMNNETHIEE